MATGQAAGTIGEIAELLGDERGLLRRPSRPSKGKGGKSSSNGPMMSSKGTAAGVYAKVEDPWLNADPWSTGGAGGGGGGGGLRPQDNGRGSGSTVLSPTEARPVEAWGDNGSGNGSTRPPPTEARGNNENGSGSTGPPSTEVSPESLVEKLSRFLLAKPNLISQRKEVLLASCERGHKLVDSMQLSSSIVEEAFRLARRRLAEAAAPAEPEAATETDAEAKHLGESSEERRDWGWKDPVAGNWWQQHDDRWGQSNWWEGTRDHSWKDDNTTSHTTWQPDNNAEARNAAAIPVSDDEVAEEGEDLPDEQLVDRLVLYLRQKDDIHKGMAVLRSCASGVPRPAAEAAIARVFAETQDFQ